jgi:hypothetical protein
MESQAVSMMTLIMTGSPILRNMFTAPTRTFQTVFPGI